jgi:hypothetical protein
VAANVDQFQNLSSLAYATQEGVQERHVASEDTLGLIRNDIGKPGTYGPGAAPAAVNPNTNTPPVASSSSSAPIPDGILNRGSLNFKNKASAVRYDKLIKSGYTSEEAQQTMGGAVTDTSTSMFKNSGTSGAGGGLSVTKGGQVGNNFKLDPTKAAAGVEGSSAFRQVSQMMAESEQLLSRSGPLYDEMIRSTQLPIIESAAAGQRENVEALRTAMARGGTARRDAFAAVQKMRSQDAINMRTGQNLADAHMKLDTWTRTNAAHVINFSDQWSSNQAGVRDNFNAAMDNAANMMSSQALPFMFGAVKQAQDYRDANSAAQRNNVNKWISGVVGLVAGAVGEVYGGSGAGVSDFGKMTTSDTASVSLANGGVSNNTATATYTQAPDNRTLSGDIKGAASSAYNYVTG